VEWAFWFLCGDTAHLHKQVLSEVVFGEFHPAIRTPFEYFVRVVESGSRKSTSGVGVVVVVDVCGGGGRNGCVSKKKKKFWAPTKKKKKKTHLRSLISLKNYNKGGKGILPR
jgi:hypothetical protein